MRRFAGLSLFVLAVLSSAPATATTSSPTQQARVALVTVENDMATLGIQLNADSKSFKGSWPALQVKLASQAHAVAPDIEAAEAALLNVQFAGKVRLDGVLTAVLASELLYECGLAYEGGSDSQSLNVWVKSLTSAETHYATAARQFARDLGFGYAL